MHKLFAGRDEENVNEWLYLSKKNIILLNPAMISSTYLYNSKLSNVDLCIFFSISSTKHSAKKGLEDYLL